jgi:hypothetical protein
MKQFIAGTFLAAFLTTVSISSAQAQETSILQREVVQSLL